MKRMLLLFVLFGLACSTTNLAMTATATPVPGTPTIPPPTVTSTVTVTPPPTATPQPTATALPAVISPENVARLVVLKEINTPSLRRVVFSPDGSFFATAAGNDADFGVNTWSAQTGKQISTFPYYTGIVWDLVFSPDGKLMATAADDQNNSHVRILDAASGKQVLAIDGMRNTNSVAFSPDGKKLAVGGSGSNAQGVIWIYDTGTWQRTQTFNAPGQNVLALLFNRDGSQLISSGTDGKIRVWAMANGKQVREMFRGREMNRLALSPDGSLMASSFCNSSDAFGCARGGVIIWRTSDWGLLQQFPDLAEGLVFSPDGSLLVTVSGANDPQTHIRRVYDWSVTGIIPSAAYGVAISPDGRTLATMSFTKATLYGVR